MKTIGERIKYLRNKHKVSQQQLATGAGVQRGNISHYEKEDWNPNYETTEKIAAFFGVNADWLFYGEEDKFKNDEIPYTESKDFQSIDSSANKLNDREFGERLKLAISSSNLTLNDLADKIGVTKNSVNNYVSGRIPGASVLYKLAKVIGTSMEWLLTGEDLNQQDISDEEPKVEHILGKLSDEEVKFIEMLRQVDDHEKAKIEGMLEIKIAEAQATKKEMSSPYQNGNEEAATEEKLA